jgi:uncharacterized protein YjbJ (UPF0337 family)
MGHTLNKPTLEADGHDEKLARKVQKKIGDVESTIGG